MCVCGGVKIGNYDEDDINNYDHWILFYDDQNLLGPFDPLFQINSTSG